MWNALIVAGGFAVAIGSVPAIAFATSPPGVAWRESKEYLAVMALTVGLPGIVGVLCAFIDLAL